MKNVLKKIYKFILMSGFDPLRSIAFLKHYPGYLRDKRIFLKKMKKTGMNLTVKFFPVLNEKTQTSGHSYGHYFFQDLWAAQKIFEHKPIKHVDVGSRVDGFIAHVAVFRKIEVFDIRASAGPVENIIFKKFDLSVPLPERYKNYCDSLSCLHALEHFGLGRYGDPVDPDAFMRGYRNLVDMLKKNGILYFSVPLGPSSIEFNAHRIFSMSELYDLLKTDFDIKELAVIDDKGKFSVYSKISQYNMNNNYNCRYGCAVFRLKKI